MTTASPCPTLPSRMSRAPPTKKKSAHEVSFVMIRNFGARAKFPQQNPLNILNPKMYNLKFETFSIKLCNFDNLILSGTCDGGIFTFEKTTAHFLRTGRETPLELASNTPGITSECATLCGDRYIYF